MSLHTVTLYCLAKLIAGEYDMPQRLPVRQKRQWLRLSLLLLSHLERIFRHIQRCLDTLWQHLGYSEPRQLSPDARQLLEFLQGIAEGKRPLFDNDNNKEYPSPDTFITPPKTILKGGLQGVNTKRGEPFSVTLYFDAIRTQKWR